MAMEYEGIGKTSNDGENISLSNKGFVDRSISAVAQMGSKLLVALEPQLGESTGVFWSQGPGRFLDADERCKGSTRNTYESPCRVGRAKRRF